MNKIASSLDFSSPTRTERKDIVMEADKIKVLFLDIDGVCNSEEYARSDRHVKKTMFNIDEPLTNLIRDIVEATACEVVLSSTWRKYPDLRQEVREKVVSFIDWTDDLGKLRGDEVNKWLSEHPEVEKYAILDDDNDFYPDQPLFRTTFKTGITEEIRDKVIEHFNG